MLERKGMIVRLVAAILDGLIVGIAAAVLVTVAGKVGMILAALAYAAYPAIEVLRSQSPGKMILKLRVTAEDGSAATRDQLVQRSLIRWAPTLAGAALTVVALLVPALAAVGNLAVLAASVALLVLSLKTMQATNQAFWDIKAKAAVMGPVGQTIPGLPAQPAAVQA